MRVFLEGEEVKVLPLSEVIENCRNMNQKEILKWKPRIHTPRTNHPWKRGPKAKNMQMAV
jgi:hypothetical protein